MKLPLAYSAMLAVLLLASCGDSRELVERGKVLDAEIAEIETQLAAIEEQLTPEVVDVGEEHELVREQLVKMKDEATRLDSLLIDLRDEKESLELRFTNYRNTHPIN